MNGDQSLRESVNAIPQTVESLTQKSESAVHHSCAFCPNPISTTAEDLRWAGWRRRGSYWVCPDCIGGQA